MSPFAAISKSAASTASILNRNRRPILKQGICPLTAFALSHLTGKLSSRERPYRLCKFSFFIPPDYTKWYADLRRDLDNFSRDLRNANKKVGLKWTCLDFRHTFGSQLAMKGESLYKISALMGNLPEICRRHYAALIPETMIESVEFVGKVFSGYRRIAK